MWYPANYSFVGTCESKSGSCQTELWIIASTSNQMHSTICANSQLSALNILTGKWNQAHGHSMAAAWVWQGFHCGRQPNKTWLHWCHGGLSYVRKFTSQQTLTHTSSSRSHAMTKTGRVENPGPHAVSHTLSERRGYSTSCYNRKWCKLWFV